MAHVVLPCDMPWWDELKNRIEQLIHVQNVNELVSKMQLIYNLCDVGLDPSEEVCNLGTKVLAGLKTFFEDDFSEIERNHFFDVTLPIIVDAALNLKSVKPIDGLHFSLQQEVSNIEINRRFACSLIAHSFLSSFPKRTNTSHPTLQDFNFSAFFQHLDKKFQKCKLLSIFHYFDVQNQNYDAVDTIKISRQIMKNGTTESLSIEDWLECDSPLCPLSMKHDSHLEDAESENSMFVCFSSKKPGGQVLNDGHSRECVQFVTCPELLVTLLCVEALQDNEVLIVENLLQTGKIVNDKLRGEFEPLWNGNTLNICIMDAEDYAALPLNQYNESNVLRELNKALLGFLQKRQQLLLHRSLPSQNITNICRRLSPIGESTSTTPTQKSDMANKDRLANERWKKKMRSFGFRATHKNRSSVQESCEKCRFVCSNDDYSTCLSDSDTCSSPEQKFYSAVNSFSEYENFSDEEENVRRYSGELDTVEHRNSFAERLREALQRAQSTNSNSDGDSSYAVDISVAGSSIADANSIRMKRGGSRGFMLENDSLDGSSRSHIAEYHNLGNNEDDVYYQNSFLNTRKIECKRNKGDSSRYSFSTDYTASDFEDVYDELNRWLEGSPIAATVASDQSFDTATTSNVEHSQKNVTIVDDKSSTSKCSNDNNRRRDVIKRFTNNLLKRALSESFVGVPLTGDITFGDHDEEDGEANEETPQDDRLSKNSRCQNNNLLLKIANKSSSFDVAKHAKHKQYSAKLVSTVNTVGRRRSGYMKSDGSCENGLMTIVTGNWGCGSRNRGDVQLKLLIQWLAGSVAGVPQIIYYTANHRDLSKLDTVCRVLVDRRWNVGELVSAVVYYTHIVLHRRRNKPWEVNPSDCNNYDHTNNLFDLLINSDKKISNIQKKILQ